MRERLTGALLASSVSGLLALLMRCFINPRFLDEPGGYAFVTLVPLIGLGWWLGPVLPTRRGPWPWMVVSSVLFGLACLPPFSGQVSTRLVVVGIDGVTWNVADKVSMPALEQLQARGRRGTLMAEEPLFSPLLWSTLATGQRPDQHGIRGLNVRSDQATAARFWEVARSHGITVGLYKWLVTWPPPGDEVPGFTVPAWLAADASTHPSSLSWVKQLELSKRSHRKQVTSARSVPELIREGMMDGLRWSTLWAGLRFQCMEWLSPMPARKREAFLRRLRLRIDRDVFIDALHEHEPELATFTIYVTDALSHTHWSRDGGRHVEGAYRLADTVLGEIVGELSSDATVLVLSDHGFRNAGEDGGAHAAVPKIERLKSHLEAAIGPVEVVRVGRKLVITPEVPLADAAIEAAMTLLTYGDGTPLYRTEVFKGSIAWSVSIQSVPPEDEWAAERINGSPLSEYVVPGRTDEGEHDPSGIVVLAGPDTGTDPLGSVSQLDVAPTILSVMGLPAALDMPGESWVPEMVERVPTHRALAPARVEREEPANTERLRSLGYVD